jgi:phage gpG-like protein
VVAVEIRFNEKETGELVGVLDTLGDMVADFSSLWPEIIPVMISALVENFEGQGNVAGPWTPLSPKWLAYKLKHGYDPRILHMTGAMRAACTTQNAPGNILELDATHLFWGLDMTQAGKEYNYARVHDVTGVKSSRGRIVREFMALRPDQKAAVLKVLTDEVRGVVIARRRSSYA